MGGRRRYLRPLALFVLLALYSFSLIGQTDSRLYIGGFDWELENEGFDESSIYLSDAATNTDEPEISETSAIDTTVTNKDLMQSVDIINQPLAVNDTAATPVVQEQENVLNDKQVVSDIPEVVTPEPQVEREKPTFLVHKVTKGETLWDIANAYGITVDSILSANEITNSNRISIGQELEILTVKGVLHQVANGESVWEISQRYGVSVDEITRVNDISDPSRIKPADRLVIPGVTKLLKKDVLVVNGVLQKAFDSPVVARISSHYGQRWGRMHNGMDYAVPTGTSIKAAADGRVIYSGSAGTYGILVTIDHGNNVETRYAHNSRVAVKVGQTVKRGDVISYSGNTGNSTGPHLHFEIRYKGSPVNPYNYLK